MRTKSLNYAYPTSSVAIKLRMPSGCWYISINGTPIAAFDTKKKMEALSYFESEEGDVDMTGSFTRESIPFKEGK